MLHLEASQFRLGANLARLVLDNVYLLSWFPPSSFPLVHSLLVRRLDIALVRGNSADDLFRPFPSLRTAAVLAGDGWPTYRAEAALHAPPTLKHLMLDTCDATTLYRIFDALPCRLETLSIAPDLSHETVSVYQLLDLMDEVPPSLDHLARLVVPQDAGWVEATGLATAVTVQELRRACEQRGVELVRWTAEETESWSMQDWRKEE